MNTYIHNPNSTIYLNFGYLMLPVSLNIVPEIRIGNEVFFAKKGYHVSLLRLRDLPGTKQKKIFNFAKKYPVKHKRITQTFRLAKEENRKSIIVRVQLRGLRKLIYAVNKHFSCSFVYPPTHITLFILKGMDGGIGVNSINEYKHLTHQISQKDYQGLINSFKLIDR